MWQLQASIALDLARERAAEADAYRRARAALPSQPSLARRAIAALLRGFDRAAASLACSASSLADRLDPAA